MAIKEFITLEGVDEVERELKKLAEAGEESLGKFRKEIEIPGIAIPRIDTAQLAELSKQTDGIAESAANASTSVSGFRDSLALLKGTAALTGIELGKLGALSRAAFRFGPGGIAAAAGAGALVGLATLEEESRRTLGQLTDLFSGSEAAGKKAFEALNRQAKEFGSSVGDLQPGLEAFQKSLAKIKPPTGFVALRAADLPGAKAQEDIEGLTEAYGNFIKLLRAGRLDQDKAEKSATAFFAAIKDGRVTVEAFEALPIGTQQLLTDAFTNGRLSVEDFTKQIEVGAVSADRLKTALINFGPEAQKAFDTKAIKTMGEEIGKIGATLSEVIRNLTGKGFSDFIVGELQRIRKGIEATITDLKRLRQFETATGSDVVGKTVSAARDFVRDLTTAAKQGFDEAGFEAIAGAVQKLPPKFIDASNSLQKLGATGTNAGKQIAQGLDQASASLQQLRDRARVTGEELQDVVIGDTRFKGKRLQIPVFEPRLAGETTAAEAAAKEAARKAAATVQQTFIENPFFKEGVTVPVKAEVDQDTFQQNLDFLKTSVDEIFGANPVEVQFDQQTPLTLFDALWNSLQTIFNKPIQLKFEGGPLTEQSGFFASGGMVRGPGSATSDSILARLSRGEYVINARATAAYLPLIHAINSMRLPRDFLGGFNMGGLARAISGRMRFAEGGAVAGGRSLTLVLDQKSFSVSGSKSTVDALEREASLRGLAMIGKAPSWIR